MVLHLKKHLENVSDYYKHVQFQSVTLHPSRRELET